MQRDAAQWHTPIMDRAALKEGEAAKAFQDTLSQLVVPGLATPVDAFHAYVLRTFQVQGPLCLPMPESAPRKEWLSAGSWQCMQLLATWRKQGTSMRLWRNHALVKSVVQRLAFCMPGNCETRGVLWSSPGDAGSM
jgi:hypothetical protein